MRILDAPVEINARVHEFCRDISHHEPLYVPVKPQPNSKLGYCFDNVARQIERRGGATAYGWAVWHWPGKYFEAEHHGVWKSPSGALVDISPQLNRKDKILFLPDPVAIYSPAAFRNNILKAEGNDPVAEEFVSAGRESMEILNRYRRPSITMPVLSLGDSLRLWKLKTKMEMLAIRMNG